MNNNYLSNKMRSLLTPNKPRFKIKSVLFKSTYVSTLTLVIGGNICEKLFFTLDLKFWHHMAAHGGGTLLVYNNRTIYL